MLLESFREKSRACDKLLMELCFASSSQRTNEQCREPLAARTTEPILEASMETWQDGVQQQQEPHVFWAPALCLHIRSAPPAQQYPMGSCFPMATPAPAAQTSPLLHSPTPPAFLPSPQAHSGGLPSLLPLRSREVVRKCVTENS